MRDLTLSRIADACGGILHLAEGRENEAYAEVTQIVTDSRQAGEGSLFAAIAGERVDGHKFIPQVFAQGALCVLTEHDLPEAAGHWIKVRSTLQALKEIAEEYLRILHIPVVGVTGSVGKTSTKEFIAGVLTERYDTLKTAGNFNNELGLPLTVFRLREEEMAVLEMGINHFGEMHRLAKVARPDTCVITNIGQCHLEFLIDRDGVLRAKTEIFDFIQPGAHIVLNGNDDKLAQVKNVQGIEPIFYGFPEEQQADQLSVWADEVTMEGLRGSSCRIHLPDETSFTVHVPLPGRHMIMNAMAAAAVGYIYGLTSAQIKAGIEGLEAVGGRLHIIETPHYEIIDDCYNANPVSMKASLDVLAQAEGIKVAVVGDMMELGEGEIDMHRSCGAHAAHLPLDLLVAIGERSKYLVEEACRENPSLRALHFADVDAFLQEQALLPDGASVLVKASHSMQFERIVKALEERA